MSAVQVMRDRAEKAGNLKSTSQEKVSKQGQTIVIEPADPEAVYVPEYDPWLVYGGPIGIWPGWYSYPGLYIGGPGIAFGLGFGIGFFGGFGWGWGHWGYDWLVMEFSSTTTATFPTAEFSSIATTSIVPEDFMEAVGFIAPVVFMAETPEASGAASMDSRRHLASLVPTQAHSADLIMEELREDFLLVGSLASAVASMEEAEAVMEAAVTASSIQLPQPGR
jgi:Protein of unknown function (DUF3300)